MSRFLASCWLLALLAAGCGGSSERLTIAMKDMRFRSAEAHVQAGEPVMLCVVYEDSLPAPSTSTPLPLTFHWRRARRWRSPSHRNTRAAMTSTAGRPAI